MPPVPDCTVASFCAAFDPHCCAMTSTLSPALLVETGPVPVTLPPRIRSSGFALKVSESVGPVTVIVPRKTFPFVFGSEYEYDPPAWKVQLPLAAGCSTSGFGRQLKPVVVLKLTWCATVSELVKVTMSSGAIVRDLGT